MRMTRDALAQLHALEQQHAMVQQWGVRCDVSATVIRGCRVSQGNEEATGGGVELNLGQGRVNDWQLAAGVNRWQRNIGPL